jgi:MFS family permease
MTFGVMHGAGANLCYMSAIWIVRKNLQKYRDTAFGMASAGSGAGGVIFGIVLPVVVESRGWREAMEIVSYVTLALIVVSMVMVEAHAQQQPELEKGAKEEAQKKKLLSSWKRNLKGKEVSVPSPWRNRAFAVLSVAILLCAFVSSVPYCHIVSILVIKYCKIYVIISYSTSLTYAQHTHTRARLFNSFLSSLGKLRHSKRCAKVGKRQTTTFHLDRLADWSDFCRTAVGFPRRESNNAISSDIPDPVPHDHALHRGDQHRQFDHVLSRVWNV